MILKITKTEKVSIVIPPVTPQLAQYGTDPPRRMPTLPRLRSQSNNNEHEQCMCTGLASSKFEKVFPKATLHRVLSVLEPPYSRY